MEKEQTSPPNRTGVLSLDEKEARNMALLFLHTAVNQIPLEETKPYKNKDEEK